MAIQATSAVPSAAANGKHGHSLISDEKFHQLYTLALNFHFAVERGVTALAGREAALAGVAADLRPEDLLIAEHDASLLDPSPAQAHGTHHAQLQSVAATSDRIIDALGMAVANRMRHNHHVTVLFFPQDPTGDVLSEARSIAAGARLPVIFVEQGSDSASSRRSTAKPQAAVDLMSIPVDAHDVVAIYRVAHESISRARQGSGPTRILCHTLPNAGVESSNVVAKLEAWLTARGLPAQQWRQQIVAKAQTSNSTEWQATSGSNELPENAA